MKIVTKEQIKRIHTLLSIWGTKRKDPVSKGEKQNLVLSYTEGMADSTTQLTYEQAEAMIADLNAIANGKTTTFPPGQEARRKIIAIARKLHWEVERRGAMVADMERIDSWCRQQKYKKGLNEMSVKELGVIVEVVEIMYNGYLKRLHNLHYERQSSGAAMPGV